jgi:AraC-like DNA-binding protein
MHTEFELTLIISGTGTRYVGDNVSRFDVGDLVFIGSGLPHYWRSQTGKGSQAHSLVIQFNKECLGNGFFEKPEMQNLLRLLQESKRGISFSGKTRTAIAKEMLTLQKEKGMNRILGFLRILDMLSLSRERRFLASEGFLTPMTSWYDERITKTCQHIFTHLSEKLTLRDIASTAGMNPQAFSRFFKKNTGQKLFDFINHVRIGHACSLLIETSMNVSEICYSSGYNNLSHFNRQFQALKKMSPRAFRHQYR